MKNLEVGRPEQPLVVAGRGEEEVPMADITATGLPVAVFDGAMSVDVLRALPDKLAALMEAACILKPGPPWRSTTGIATARRPAICPRSPITGRSWSRPASRSKPISCSQRRRRSGALSTRRSWQPNKTCA
jgi:hypothetical protein